MKSKLFDRFARRGGDAEEPDAPTVVQIDASSLSRVFSAPMWLRDLRPVPWNG